MTLGFWFPFFSRGEGEKGRRGEKSFFLFGVRNVFQISLDRNHKSDEAKSPPASLLPCCANVFQTRTTT